MVTALYTKYMELGMTSLITATLQGQIELGQKKENTIKEFPRINS